MADISQFTQAKSDQLNAVDIMGCEPIFKIRDVQVRQGDQPVWVYYEGDNNKPWKPSLGMRRILQAGWGSETDNWIGKSVQVLMNPDVIYAGKKVGGVEVKAMSDIPTNGLMCTKAVSKQKREPYPVAWLDTRRPEYPQAQFEKGLPTMVQWLQEGKTVEQIIAQCQKTGDLTQDQIKTLQEAAPVHADFEE